MKTQPDDKSTRMTRAVGNITGWLGSFPAIGVALALVLLWFVGAIFVPQHFVNNIYGTAAGFVDSFV